MASSLVKDFLARLEPEEVPFEFLAGATYNDPMGNEVMLKGEELKMLMNNHPDYAFVNARIYINMNRIIKAINLEVDYIIEMVNLYFMEEEPETDES